MVKISLLTLFTLAIGEGMAYKATFYSDASCKTPSRVITKTDKMCHNIKPGKYKAFKLQMPTGCNTTFYAASNCVTELGTVEPASKGVCEMIAGSSVASYKLSC